MKGHGLPGDDVEAGVEAGVGALVEALAGDVNQRRRPGGRGTSFEVVSR